MDIIKEKIFNILGEHLNLDISELSEDSLLFDELSMTSIDIVDIAMSLEDEFLIELPDTIPPNLSKISDIIEIVKTALDKKTNYIKLDI